MRSAALVVLVALSGCSAAGGSSFERRDAGRDSGGGDPGGFILGEAGAPGGDGCSDAARLVYVVSAENALYSFAPESLAFTRIGTLGCAAGAATPNSMAVDRGGTAWVNYSDGRIFKVSTADASCAPTALTLGGATGLGPRIGMGFSSDVAGGQEETLYIADLAGRGLGMIDTSTLAVTRLAGFGGTLSGKSCELTGTGDARLFGFFDTAPATLAEITKTTAATTAPRPLTGVTTGSHYAFSFWGGDFWFYTASGTSSAVTRHRTSGDGSIAVVVPSTGFRIVGAGVSTCAPVRPPA